MRMHQFMSLAVLLGTAISIDGWLCQGALAAFTDVSDKAGVREERPSRGNPIWADFDNDGDLDIVVINHANNVAVYRNNGDGTFTDVKQQVGIFEGEYRDRHGATWGDCDNDGDPDLFITQGNRRGQAAGLKHDELYLNDGTGHFTEIGATSGATNECCAGHSANWVDFDNDGHLDLFVKNNKQLDRTQYKVYRNLGACQFEEVNPSTQLPVDLIGIYSSWADYNNDGFVDLFITGEKDRLFRNNGDETFTEVSEEAGLGLELGRGMAWGDYDDDGDLDLYITRGRADAKNALFWDSSRIVFSDIIRWFDVNANVDGLDFITEGEEVTFDIFWDTKKAKDFVFIGAAKSHPSQLPFSLHSRQALGQPDFVPGVDKGYFIWWANGGWHVRWTRDTQERTDGSPPDEEQGEPLDGEGSEGVEDMEAHNHEGDHTASAETVQSEAANIIVPLAGVGDTASYQFGEITANGPFTQVVSTFEPRPQSGFPNTLYRNNGDGTFTDVTSAAGVESLTADRGAVWGDFDNDGRLDLYVVAYGNVLGNAPNKLFRNNGDGTFGDVAAEEGVTAEVQGHGDGAAWGDFNNDGFLDLFVTNSFGLLIEKGPQLLFRNNGNSNNWLKLKLVGTSSNRDAMGARVSLEAAGKSQFRAVNEGGGGVLQAQGSGPLHFGLGAAKRVDTLQIRWPSGRNQTIANIGANQLVTLVEGQDTAMGQPAYKLGVDLGYFIWRAPEGTWHVRWSGDGLERRFKGSITTDGVFSDVAPVAYESNDRFVPSASTIDFNASASTDQDGLEFRASGQHVSFDITIDGKQVPASIHIGQFAVSPAFIPLTLPQ
jgi:ASPIC and UnbV/FG-GAP-like repeat